MMDIQPLGQGQPVISAAAMRAHEATAFARGVDPFALMTTAGEQAARAIRIYCGPEPVLVLCGPGNNGGDGYIIAQALADAGWPVRVAALAPPATGQAQKARARWSGAVETLDQATPAPVLVDALFGIGLARPLAAPLASRLADLMVQARHRIAIDVPSGVGTDDGALLGAQVAFDMTVTFAALKPAHLLQPAAGLCGRLVVADIGIGQPESDVMANGPPALPVLARDTHKYRRGHVMVFGGRAAGAALLCAQSAQRGGAGYVSLLTMRRHLGFYMGQPSSVVLDGFADASEAAERAGRANVGAISIGPGLGTDRAARSLAEAVLATAKPVVVDADMFSLFANEPDRLFRCLPHQAVLSPHEGEFARLFGTLPGATRLERARAAAVRAGGVVILKGADTVIAAPDGRAAINHGAPPWLATAGSGDVLSGLIAALLARGMDSFSAACAAVWLHGAAAQRCGPAMIAEDLVVALGTLMDEQ